MIFIQANYEDIIQVEDKTRIDVRSTFISPDEAAITLVEIEPEASAGYVDVTSTKYLDWAYATAGAKTATVRITTDSTPITKALTITAISVADDRLFSNDKDIISHEVDIYRFLRVGRASFLDFHRLAQKKILDDLDQRGLTKLDGTKLTKENIFITEELKEWSKYLTLSLIFKSVQSEVGDVYGEKSLEYANEAKKQSVRYSITIDTDGDGDADTMPDLTSGRLVRR